MKKVFYWSPYLSNVATIKAVINSVKGLKKFSNEYEPILVNVCGEFDNYKNELDSLNIKVVDLTFFSYHKYLPYKGYIFSRISFSIIFLISFLPLIFLISIIGSLNRKSLFISIMLFFDKSSKVP